MKEVAAFKCDCCSMVSIYKGHVIRHEKHSCRKSTERRCCLLCVNMETDPNGVFVPYCNELDMDIDYETLNKNNECECFISKIVKVEKERNVMKKVLYGYCPVCGAPGRTRERRPNGDDTCENRHKYPSKDAWPWAPPFK